MKQDPWIPTSLPASSKAIRSGAGQLGGFSVAETAGSTAKIRLWDNATSASGTLVATIPLTANAGLTKEFKWGVRLTNGLFVEVVSGAVEGSLFTN